MSGVFNDEGKINKQLVMGKMYHKASEYIHRENVVILPSGYPFRAIRRLFRYGIVGKESSIFGYEFDKKAALKWFEPGERSNIWEIEKRLKESGYPCKVDKMFKFKVGDVREAPACRLIDFDFCGPWFCKKDIEAALKDPRSSVNIILDGIDKQKKAFPNQHKVIMGTISPRNVGSKEWSYKCLDMIHERATGNSIYSIDSLTNGYGVGEQIADKGFKHTNGSIRYAYEHNVECRSNAKMYMFTYSDGQTMLSFVLIYK